jgi:hypothetical protein
VNVRSLYRVGSLTAAARELARYKLDLLGFAGGYVGQRGHCKNRGLQFFLWKRKRESSIGNRIVLHHRIVSAVKSV